MRSFFIILLFIFAVSAGAKPLDAPNYDPFKQTQKILTHKVEFRSSPKRKRYYILYAIYDEKVNINGNFYGVGDIVGSCKVIKILSKKVILKCHNKIKTIEFLTKKTYQRVGK